MRCDNCKGRGWNPSPNFTSYGAESPTHSCFKCGGTGFILRNVKEAIELINVHISSNTSMSVRDLKGIKRAILKLPT